MEKNRSLKLWGVDRKLDKGLDLIYKHINRV